MALVTSLTSGPFIRFFMQRDETGKIV